MQRAALLPRAKQWRFAPDALERWRGEHGDFLARHLTDSAYLARMARLYLRRVCDPDQVWVVPGRLTALLRGALGLNSAALLGKGGMRKQRIDHRHHAIDALTVGLIDRALLWRVATAAGRAQASGRRLLDTLPDPWPGFVPEAAGRLRGIVVSFKPDTSPAGRLHNDTAYGEIAGAGPGEPNVAHRVPVRDLAGWKPDDVAEAVADPLLAARVAEALRQHDGKPAQAAALERIAHDAQGRMVRRVRVRERVDTVAINDRRTKRPYKRVKTDSNHCAEFWRLPSRAGKPGRLEMVVVPTLLAAGDAEARRLGRPVPDRRPHPAAKLLMRLHKYDVVAFGAHETRRLLRVVKFTDGSLTLADLHEAGSLKARHNAPDDPFRYVMTSPGSLRAQQARKVLVDPAGRVLDPGPIRW